jgi:hypothetical protein
MVLMLVLTSLLFLLIMIPVIETYVKNEAKWSVKEKKSTLAFHLAEAGMDRGYWKLIEKTVNWDTIIAGGNISGYANDKVYTDIQGGSYKINITSAAADKVAIIATGKDVSNNEYRAIKAVYSKSSISATVYGNQIEASGSVEIVWGPQMSLNKIQLSGTSNQLYPRKYARGAITASGTYGNRDTDPNPPNKGPQADPYTEWWSYNEPPGVPDLLPPTISYYRQKAQEQGYYYSTNQNLSNLVDTACTVGSEDKVRFFEQDAKFTGSKYFCGILIVLGDLDFTGSGASESESITVTPHSDAWKEYQVNVPKHAGATEGGNIITWNFYAPPGSHDSGTCNPPHGDTDALHEYPGDGGYHTSEPFNFKNGCITHNNSDFSGESLSFQGYIYVGEDLESSGSTWIYGVIHAPNDEVDLSGSVKVFYKAGMEIKGLKSQITKTSWYEIKPEPF